MSSRYQRDFGVDLGPPQQFQGSQAFAQPEAPARRKKDPLQDMLRLAAGVAPAAGTLIGGGIGAVAGGGIPGAMLGAGLGSAAGTALGGLAGYGADQMAEPQVQAEEDRVNRERERQARAQAALQVLGSM